MSISKFYSIRYDREIGKGASGQVYEAKRRSDNQTVAVKIIFRRNLNQISVAAIANEVSALQKLDHPNIVKLYDMFEDRHTYYLCLEFIPGGELFYRITQKQFYTEQSARDLCRAILSAIKHCHDNDLVHRDLKPENLLMLNDVDDTSVKLVDFGFSSFAHDLTLTGVLGTPIYMAPEIWKCQSYGKPVDMWAFGVITYILLAGYPPFSDNKREQLVLKITHGKFAFHPEFWGTVSVTAQDFVSSLLNTDHTQRLTVEQAFAHPWLHSQTLGLEHNSLECAVSKLRTFNAMRKLKAVVQTIMLTNRWGKVARGSAKPGTVPAEPPANTEPVDTRILSELVRQNTHHPVGEEEEEEDVASTRRNARTSEQLLDMKLRLIAENKSLQQEVDRMERLFGRLLAEQSGSANKNPLASPAFGKYLSTRGASSSSNYSSISSSFAPSPSPSNRSPGKSVKPPLPVISEGSESNDENSPRRGFSEAHPAPSDSTPKQSLGRGMSMTADDTNGRKASQKIAIDVTSAPPPPAIPQPSPSLLVEEKRNKLLTALSVAIAGHKMTISCNMSLLESL